MAGRVARRNRIRAQKPYYGTRWCDRPDFVGPSKGPLGNAVYFLCTPYGWMTVHEEYVCWIYAVSGNATDAFRKVYFPKRRSGKDIMLKKKQLERVKDLQRMHREGRIDLKKGPWEEYGVQIGNPEAHFWPCRRDYSDIGL